MFLEPGASDCANRLLVDENIEFDVRQQFQGDLAGRLLMGPGDRIILEPALELRLADTLEIVDRLGWQGTIYVDMRGWNTGGTELKDPGSIPRTRARSPGSISRACCFRSRSTGLMASRMTRW